MAAKIIQSIVIAVAQENVFDYTQNYEQRLSWDTFLKIAKLIGVNQAGKGVKAWCVSKQGLGMETEYVTYNRPKVTAIKMTKGPFMFKSFAGSWKFEKVGEDFTKVNFTYNYQLRFPFNLLKFIINRVLTANVKQRLIDLKICLEENRKLIK